MNNQKTSILMDVFLVENETAFKFAFNYDKIVIKYLKKIRRETCQI